MAVEYLDKKVIRVVKEQLEARGEEFRLLVLPDHPTPICLRTHVGEPVPFLLYDSTDKKTSDLLYNEKDAKKSGIYIENGYKIIDHLFEK